MPRNKRIANTLELFVIFINVENIWGNHIAADIQQPIKDADAATKRKFFIKRVQGVLVFVESIFVFIALLVFPIRSIVSL